MEINKIGVVGAGQMGAGIAQVAATAGYTCIVYDNSEEALKHSAILIDESLAKLQKKSIISDKEKVFKRLSWCHDLNDFSACDLIIEAIVECEQAKENLFKTLDLTVKNPKTIFASNTSSISITRLAQAISRPENFIGLHFMNPVPLMKLVEIIPGAKTSPQTVKIIKGVVESMVKAFVVAKDFPGFICNRILMPMINEAFFALMEGVSDAEDIDNSMKLGCNFPMGPLALADFIGLDTCLFIIEVLHDGLGDDKYRPCPLLRQYVDAGMLGRKSGVGVYKYDRS